ncbi:hypothetical protein P22_1360 [Propionispora sp. 2/2-37]|uniref:sialate O-acetylesterase n=1 Tax=Propionispora sp. 2/2-37 TaxID=1677858 RepID=UPI0006BB65F6|nr:sialate O-acetylesterase [Propionispora sp. 2/2-37]CUH95290.1 hypothetical protein P22_1360 [Propionispora sp. 2/2-37]
MIKNKYAVAGIFTDNMVLQRDCDLPVWGEAPAGTAVQVELAGHSCATTAGDANKWKVLLPPLPAGGPYRMRIRLGANVICLDNILVGEVWLAGGQSNMEFPLKDSTGGAEEISGANYEWLRQYEVAQIEYEDGLQVVPDLPAGVWKVCTPECAGSFSAVAYYFAKRVYADLHIPIGIISCNKGGTSAACWMSEEYLTRDRTVRACYLKPYYRVIANLTEAEEAKREQKYLRRRALHDEKIRAFKEKHPKAGMEELKQSVGHTPWPPPLSRKAYGRPAGLYHTMLEKVIPYAIKGVLWYQGEEDTRRSELYRTLFTLLIADWRERWHNRELPFVFVQLPAYHDTKPLANWPAVREAQLQVTQTIPSTFMAVTIDCGEKFDIHPPLKKPVGERLALAALTGVYGVGKDGLSPVYSHHVLCDRRFVVYFDNLEGGILVGPLDACLQGFEVCGQDGIFFPAEAQLRSRTVVVDGKQVEKPVRVRYAWSNYTQVILYTNYGLPVSPFQTR